MNNQIALYTTSHDACGEPSWMKCTVEQADAIEQHNTEALTEFEKQGFKFNKWDLRTNWTRTTVEKAKAMWAEAMDAQEVRREQYEAEEARKRDGMDERTYEIYKSWLKKDVKWMGWGENNQSVWTGTELTDTPDNRAMFMAAA